MTGKEEVPDGASTAGAARPANIKAQRMAMGSTGVMESEMESRRRYYEKRIVGLSKEERIREREREKSTCCTVR